MKHQQYYRLNTQCLIRCSETRDCTLEMLLKAARLVEVCSTQINHSVNWQTVFFIPTTDYLLAGSYKLSRVTNISCFMSASLPLLSKHVDRTFCVKQKKNKTQICRINWKWLFIIILQFIFLLFVILDTRKSQETTILRQRFNPWSNLPTTPEMTNRHVVLKIILSISIDNSASVWHIYNMYYKVFFFQLNQCKYLKISQNHILLHLNVICMLQWNIYLVCTAWITTRFHWSIPFCDICQWISKRYWWFKCTI